MPPEPSRPRVSPDPGTGASLLRILLVDDHPMIQLGYQCLLEGSGRNMQVHTASNGREGYLAFIRWQPHVTMLDITLPGVSGLEVMRRMLRRDPNARILIYSMHEGAAFIRRAREMGARGYLCKRLAALELVDAVDRVSRGEEYFYQCTSSPDGVEQRNPPSLKVPTHHELEKLTHREFEVFRLLAEGYRSREIAQMLNISPKTAAVHQTRIMNKLELSSLAQLARLALHHRIVEV